MKRNIIGGADSHELNEIFFDESLSHMADFDTTQHVNRMGIRLFHILANSFGWSGSGPRCIGPVDIHIAKHSEKPAISFRFQRATGDSIYEGELLPNLSVPYRKKWVDIPCKPYQHHANKIIAGDAKGLKQGALDVADYLKDILEFPQDKNHISKQLFFAIFINSAYPATIGKTSVTEKEEASVAEPQPKKRIKFNSEPQKITAVYVKDIPNLHDSSCAAPSPEIEDFIDDNKVCFANSAADNITMSVAKTERKIEFAFADENGVFDSASVNIRPFAKKVREYGAVLEMIQNNDGCGSDRERADRHLELALQLAGKFKDIMQFNDVAWKTERWLFNIFLAAAFPAVLERMTGIKAIYEKRFMERARG